MVLVIEQNAIEHHFVVLYFAMLAYFKFDKESNYALDAEYLTKKFENNM